VERRVEDWTLDQKLVVGFIIFGIVICIASLAYCGEYKVSQTADNTYSEWHPKLT